jgi:hypothetical protein
MSPWAGPDLIFVMQSDQYFVLMHDKHLCGIVYEFVDMCHGGWEGME